jgi:hypothetical protein
MIPTTKDEPRAWRERRVAASDKERPPGLLMTFARAQHELDCSRRQVYYLVERGLLSVVRIGPRGIRIRSDGVAALAQAQFEPRAIPGLRRHLKGHAEEPAEPHGHDAPDAIPATNP